MPRRLIVVVLITLLLAPRITLAADPVLVEQFMKDAGAQLVEVSPNLPSDRRQIAVDAIMADVSRTCPSALSVDSAQAEILRTGKCPFTDNQLRDKYTELKQLAGGKPMPTIVEFYRARFERGELNPTQKTLYYTFTSAIYENTQHAHDSQKRS